MNWYIHVTKCKFCDICVYYKIKHGIKVQLIINNKFTIEVLLFYALCEVCCSDCVIYYTGIYYMFLSSCSFLTLFDKFLPQNFGVKFILKCSMGPIYQMFMSFIDPVY